MWSILQQIWVQKLNMTCNDIRKRERGVFENNMRILNETHYYLLLFSVIYVKNVFTAKNTQHRCWITNIQHWWNADGKPEVLYLCASDTLPTTHPTWTTLGSNANFAVRCWRLTIRAMARPLSVHARHNTHITGTDFQTWPVEHDRALCDPSQVVCLDQSVLASWQRMTLTFHRNQYYNALMLTSSHCRHRRLSWSCFCPPPPPGRGDTIYPRNICLLLVSFLP
jgi:hypothetical protein